MLKLKLSEVALWTRGALHGADVEVRGVSTDTRALTPASLFVALKGERFDAHDFIAQAQTAGAAAALVTHPMATDFPQVVVADTELALGDLASAVRAKRRARVVGITGSNGKTSVKTLTASILSLHGNTHVNAGNFNNEIGLPLSLLAMPEEAEFAVLEMGAGKPGDIAYLAAIARPEIGLVNNIAPAHLERMGSLDGIAETKAALYAALPAHGAAIINADSPFAGAFAQASTTRNLIRFGLDAHADITAQVHAFEAEFTAFTMHLPGASIAVRLPLSGRHNVMNALAAGAIAHALGISAETIRKGLDQAPPVKGRLLPHAMPGGWTLIDDSYNANPGSAAAAIAVLAQGGGENWLVLGDMLELGADAVRLHAEIGELARSSGVSRVLTVGNLASAASTSFGKQAQHFTDQAALVSAISAQVHSGVRVLVKGSRGSAMDRIVRALLDGHRIVGGGASGTGARHAA